MRASCARPVGPDEVTGHTDVSAPCDCAKTAAASTARRWLGTCAAAACLNQPGACWGRALSAGSGTGGGAARAHAAAWADAINFAQQLLCSSPGKQRRLSKHAVAMATGLGGSGGARARRDTRSLLPARTGPPPAPESAAAAAPPRQQQTPDVRSASRVQTISHGAKNARKNGAGPGPRRRVVSRARAASCGRSLAEADVRRTPPTGTAGRTPRWQGGGRPRLNPRRPAQLTSWQTVRAETMATLIKQSGGGGGDYCSGTAPHRFISGSACGRQTPAATTSLGMAGSAAQFRTRQSGTPGRGAAAASPLHLIYTSCDRAT